MYSLSLRARLNCERNITTTKAKIYKFMKFGFLFSAKAVMPSSLASEGEKWNTRDKRQKILRTLPLVLCRERHMEQPTFSPQSLRQTLLIR